MGFHTCTGIVSRDTACALQAQGVFVEGAGFDHVSKQCQQLFILQHWKFTHLVTVYIKYLQDTVIKTGYGSI